jgi:transcription elongation factor GreA
LHSPWRAGSMRLVAGERTEYLTEAQRVALETELAELEGPRRARVVSAIKTAREHGDLSENFEYHSAKNEQGFLEARIRTLRARLLGAVTIDEAELEQGEVAPGSIVELEVEPGERMEIEISSVGGPGTVSPDSPLGRALAGRREGDEVAVEAPGGAWSARILSVRRK